MEENKEKSIQNLKLFMMKSINVLLIEIILFFVWLFVLIPQMFSDGSSSKYLDYIYYIILYLTPVVIIFGGIISVISLIKGSKKIGVLNFLSSCILFAVFIISLLLMLDILKIIKI